MRYPSLIAVTSLIAMGCKAPEAEVSGTVAGLNLNNTSTVMFGGPFIVLVDEPVDCLDMPWVSRHYSQGEAVTDFDFKALQFAYEDPDVVTGQYNVAGEAAVAAKFLVQSGGAFTEYRGRGGNLIVDSVDIDFVEGTFEVTFDEGDMSGSFAAESCRNLKDN